MLYIYFKKPSEGIWTLVRHTAKDWTIKVFAASSMYVTYQFFEKDSDGYFYPTQGNTVAGMIKLIIYQR